MTDELPKPMVPFLNRPLLDRTITWLRWHGFNHLLFNLHHRHDVISAHLSDGRQHEVTVDLRVESELTGPAGAVLAFASEIDADDDVLVVSGDLVSDVDLTGFVSAHRASGAELSVVVKRVERPERYGVALLGADSRIVEFTEKPRLGPGAVAPVSCGIYCIRGRLLDELPRREVVDFGAHLIPTMSAAGRHVHAYLTSAYWSDIGDVTSLRQANLDALSGHVSGRIHGIADVAGIHVELDATVAPSAKLEGPVLIGARATVGADVTIVGPAVIGPDATVGAGATVVRSLLIGGARVPDGMAIIEGVVASFTNSADVL